MTCAGFLTNGFILMPNFILIFDIHNVVNGGGLWQISDERFILRRKRAAGMAKYRLKFTGVGPIPDWTAVLLLSCEVARAGYELWGFPKTIPREGAKPAGKV
jgi:hypothetical protein